MLFSWEIKIARVRPWYTKEINTQLKFIDQYPFCLLFSIIIHTQLASYFEDNTLFSYTHYMVIEVAVVHEQSLQRGFIGGVRYTRSQYFI